MLPGQHHFKNSKTMKHFYLWAVAISALCSSCETTNEPILENNTATNQTLQIQQRMANDYETYNSVVSSFVYNKQLSHNNNLLLFEQHVNNLIISKNTYETLNLTQLSVLENTDEKFVSQLNYSTEAKTAITDILSNTFTTSSLSTITNTKEYNLITTLYAIYGNDNGNGDDKWRDRKTIAFAYGAQYNLTQAILYAGAIDLMKFQ